MDQNVQQNQQGQDPNSPIIGQNVPQMDPQNPGTQNYPGQQGQFNQQEQTIGQQPPQVGRMGASPESTPIPVQVSETAPKQETGYEEIKRIEKEAESDQAIEAANKRVKQKQNVDSPENSQVQPDQTREKKEVPQGFKPKVFGYKTTPQVSDPDYIKKNAGKGNQKDAKTWLLIFLDRLLKKETA